MRIKNLCFIIMLFMFILTLRLCYLTVAIGDNLAKEAYAQNTSLTTKDSDRDYIYDTNLRVIAGKNPRYKNNNLLSHVIGYTWENGASGIEKAFNDNLLSENPDLIALQKDAKGNVVGETILMSEDSYKGIKLTIDYNIQKVTEEVMDKHKLKGAVIVIDVNSGGVLAMASKPDFDRDNLTKYYASENGELINRAICQYNVGSVFKIVTAAAALETNFSKEYAYNCEGKVNINNLDFLCNKKEGHGLITFPQGFAHSCNCLFYNLGINTGYEKIREYAINFGFGEEVLRVNGFSEFKGNIPENTNVTKADVANMSIGQGDIMVTPLQVADMMCTIANDGIRKQIMLIDGFVDDKGNCCEIMPTDIGRVISTDTARSLKQMLKEAVAYGTGKSAKIENVETSGKTATAETGWLKDGELLTHGWFAGFYPSDTPEYVCVVLAEGGQFGSVSAAPVFKEIGEKILDL